ncbi:MAG: hypothetical protein HDR50_06810 [Desulfovibrio sp.]|uniref:hypothetical protein n=1 Tax=Desulfovibrio sp. TaxID=885 RepID=UPI001A7CC334|nr:hypothetical protein [Desulfovibrio sp.]MBD5417358.1 hypothetical protein [Desulfovibrio sp.]
MARAAKTEAQAAQNTGATQNTPQAPAVNTTAAEAAKTEAQAAKASGTAMVAVALNRATGIQFSMPDGRKVVINGNAAHLRGKEKGVLPVGAFGLTMVPATDWEYIKKTYGGMEIFQHGLIFAAERKADAVDEAAEKAELRHGIEPIDPENTTTKPDEAGAAVGA